MSTKICERCDVEFSCTADENCWCMKVPPIQTKIDAEDCLCATCLQAESMADRTAGEPNSVNDPRSPKDRS